ncbi:MAG: YqaA family protein [Shewanella sp.]
MTHISMMFMASFLAATLLPGGSEVLLAILLANDGALWWQLVLAATVGNTLGSMTSYLLGFVGRKAITPEQMASKGYQRSLAVIEKYGVWSLLLAWLPVIGDILCVIAGWLKFPPILTGSLIFIGKLLRYLAIAAISLHWPN